MLEPGEFTGFPSPGTLVVTSDGYFGIIVESFVNDWNVLQSDGLTVNLTRHLFLILPMKANVGLDGSVASFVELVSAYQSIHHNQMGGP